ncbi:transcriptional regulator [Deinococcus detaillensis]|uniref:Transcriptional regulator n=1 Tax=Deinococcus detaillensis TaxID=2592048 RepID=A0A553UUK0_9DEIO|nr:putative glycolipid-binding domain-containing protein [Deinococcus detaillensis]TSA83874.1 transcriptional regulator [Deinococcus detaillensis]
MTARQHVMWQSLDEQKLGLEHLLTGQGWASGTVIGKAPEGPFTLRYRLEVDGKGSLVAAVLRLSGQASLTLTRSASGRWHGNGGEELSDLSGCTDLDLNVTPYTNTLALRRLDLHPGEAGEILAVVVEVPSLTRRVTRQRYTRLGPHTYRYENLGAGFSTELKVDDDLLVREYPGLFVQI